MAASLVLNLSTVNSWFSRNSIRRLALSSSVLCSAICCVSKVSLLPSVVWFVSTSVLTFSDTVVWPLSPSSIKISALPSSSSIPGSSRTNHDVLLISPMLSRTVGALRFRGEVRVHANSEGTASVQSSVLPERIFTKSHSLLHLF